MAGAERAGEPHGRRRSAGRRPPGVRRDSDAPTPSPGTDEAASASARLTGNDAGGEGQRGTPRAIATYMRANPQVFVLLVICLVLGLGTFLAAVFGLLTAGPGQTTGEPSGAVHSAPWVAPTMRWLMP